MPDSFSNLTAQTERRRGAKQLHLREEWTNSWPYDGDLLLIDPTLPYIFLTNIEYAPVHIARTWELNTDGPMQVLEGVAGPLRLRSCRRRRSFIKNTYKTIKKCLENPRASLVCNPHANLSHSN